MVDYLYAARNKIKKGSWLPCGIQDLYSKYKICPFVGLLRCDSLIARVKSTVHNMLVDDKIFCITFTFEWTF